MKRTPLKRGTKRLSRGKGLKRTGFKRPTAVVKDGKITAGVLIFDLAPTSHVYRWQRSKNSGARYARDFGPKASWIRTLPCAGCGGTRNRIEAHHQKTRGAGGWSKHLVPLCTDCHREWHQHGKLRFDKKHECDLEVVMKTLDSQWMTDVKDRWVA